MHKTQKWSWRKRLWWMLATMVAVLVLAVGGFYIYAMDYYHAAPEAAAVNAQSQADGVSIRTDGNLTILSPSQPTGKGFVFYPGGKVEESAYLPLLERLASRGITCVLVKMPLRLAVLGGNRADAAWKVLPEVSQWYIGGHSLGGAMASSYAEKHADKVVGLVLMAAYPMRTMELPMLVLCGSEDRVVNREKLAVVKDITDIQGGNHAWFGNYGEQTGDGKATITHEEQQEQSVNAICAWMKVE